MMTFDASAATIMQRCAILARYSEEPGRLTRHFATQAMRQANEAVAGWMRDAGMSVQQEDVAVALAVVERFLTSLAEK